MGQNIKENQKNLASFQVRPDHIGNELEAYNMITSQCPFGAGASKMVGEYEQMAGRIPTFEFKWVGGATFNFNVIFPK